MATFRRSARSRISRPRDARLVLRARIVVRPCSLVDRPVIVRLLAIGGGLWIFACAPAGRSLLLFDLAPPRLHRISLSLPGSIRHGTMLPARVLGCASGRHRVLRFAKSD